MTPLLEATQQVFADGGVTMFGLAALSVALYRALFATWAQIGRIKKRQIAAPRNANPEFRYKFRAYIRSQLRFSRALIVAAPLLGLLGTVVGMLATFDALSQKKTLETTQSVADGISLALITTQAGLMIALPALFLSEWIKQKALRCETVLFPATTDAAPRK